MNPSSNQRLAGALADSDVRRVELRDAAMAYRVVGTGDPLVLVHGWPLTGMTFRHLV